MKKFTNRNERVELAQVRPFNDTKHLSTDADKHATCRSQLAISLHTLHQVQKAMINTSATIVHALVRT